MGFPVAAAKSVEECKELPMNDFDLGAMKGVARGAVDDGVVRLVLAVVDEDGPDVNNNEERGRGDLPVVG